MAKTYMGIIIQYSYILSGTVLIYFLAYYIAVLWLGLRLGLELLA